jgi:hypothetical protein
MGAKSFVPVIFAVFACFASHAITIPCQTPTGLVVKDTFTEVTLIPSGNPTAKKEGFFRKLRTKLATFIFGQRINKTSGASTKAVLGWVALGLVLLGIGLVLLSTGPASGDFLWISVAGFVTGIVALLVKGKESKPKENKKGKTAAIVAVAISVAIGIFAIIALSTW